MYNYIYQPFKEWIAHFKNIDLPIGDLAKDIYESKDFPEDDNLIDILNYLLSKKASEEAIQTFIQAWEYYLASTSLTLSEQRVAIYNLSHRA